MLAAKGSSIKYPRVVHMTDVVRGMPHLQHVLSSPRVQVLRTHIVRPLWLLLKSRQLIQHPPDLGNSISSLTRSIMRFHCTMYKAIWFCFFSARLASYRVAWTSAGEVDSGLINHHTSMDQHLDVSICFAAQKSDLPLPDEPRSTFASDSSTAGSGFCS